MNHERAVSPMRRLVTYTIVAGSILAASALTRFTSVDQPASSARFWPSLQVRNGLEVEQYASIEDMARSADLVVRGKIIRFEKGRTVYGDAPGDSLTYARAEVAILELVRGNYLDRVIPVEFMVVAPDERAAGQRILELAPAAPKDPLLLFLRHKGGSERGLYRLVNSAGLWTTAHWSADPERATPPALPTGPRALTPLNDEAFATVAWTLDQVQAKASAAP